MCVGVIEKIVFLLTNTMLNQLTFVLFHAHNENYMNRNDDVEGEGWGRNTWRRGNAWRHQIRFHVFTQFSLHLFNSVLKSVLSAKWKAHTQKRSVFFTEWEKNRWGFIFHKWRHLHTQHFYSHSSIIFFIMLDYFMLLLRSWVKKKEVNEEAFHFILFMLLLSEIFILFHEWMSERERV